MFSRHTLNTKHSVSLPYYRTPNTVSTPTMHSHPTRRDVPCINAMQMSLHTISCIHVRCVSHATYLLHYMSSVMDKLYLIHIIISIFITHISHNFTYSSCYSIYSNNTHKPFSTMNPVMLGLGNNLDLVQKVQLLSIPHKTSNTQFLAQAIRNPKHFRYKPVLKIEVPETRTDHSSTISDPTQCSTHGLDENFILLNSRLNEIFVKSNNARIGVRTRKLWPSKVDVADSQGFAKFWAHPHLPFCSGFCSPKTQCLVSNSPETP